MAVHPDTPDDDALRWDGDEAHARVLPAGWAAKGKGAEDVRRDGAAPQDAGEAPPVAERVPLGNAALVAFGMLGGVYLLYAVGWAIGGYRLLGRSASLVSDVMFQGSLWLAVPAPVVWFGAVLLLTRGRSTWLRFVWLGAGVLLLVPWPMLMTGRIGL